MKWYPLNSESKETLPPLSWFHLVFCHSSKKNKWFMHTVPMSLGLCFCLFITIERSIILTGCMCVLTLEMYCINLCTSTCQLILTALTDFLVVIEFQPSRGQEPPWDYHHHQTSELGCRTEPSLSLHHSPNFVVASVTFHCPLYYSASRSIFKVSLD